MPVGIIAHETQRVTDGMSKRQLCALLAVLVAGGVLMWLGVRASARGGVKVPAAVTEDTPPFVPPPGAPVVTVDQHAGGLVAYTVHRYPVRCGHEITALINHGHGTMFLPHVKDLNWITRPPSEVSL